MSVDNKSDTNFSQYISFFLGPSPFGGLRGLPAGVKSFDFSVTSKPCG